MINFSDFFADYYFKNIGMPFFSVFITTSVKVISRKDHSLKITKNDLAAGINLIITGLIMLINCATKIAEKAKLITEPSQQVENTNKLLNVLVLALLYCITAFLVSVLIRLFGWSKEKEEKELSTVMGVCLPIVIGCLLIVYAANSTNI